MNDQLPKRVSTRKKLDIPERKWIAKSNVVFFACDTEFQTTYHAYYDSVRYVPEYGIYTGEKEIGSRALCNGRAGVYDDTGSHWLQANAMYVEEIPKEKRCKLCSNIYEKLPETRFHIKCAYCKETLDFRDSFDEDDEFKVGETHDYIECDCGFENTVSVKEDAGGMYFEVDPYVEMTDKEREDYIDNHPYADY